jgi:hypothetical protein
VESKTVTGVCDNRATISVTQPAPSAREIGEPKTSLYLSAKKGLASVSGRDLHVRDWDKVAYQNARSSLPTPAKSNTRLMPTQIDQTNDYLRIVESIPFLSSKKAAKLGISKCNSLIWAKLTKSFSQRYSVYP